MKLIIVFLHSYRLWILLPSARVFHVHNNNNSNNINNNQRKNAKHEVIFRCFWVLLLWWRRRRRQQQCDVKCISYDARDLWSFDVCLTEFLFVVVFFSSLCLVIHLMRAAYRHFFIIITLEFLPHRNSSRGDKTLDAYEWTLVYTKVKRVGNREHNYNIKRLERIFMLSKC